MNDEIFAGREIPPDEQDKVKERIVDVDGAKLQFYEKLRAKAKAWTNAKTGKAGGKLGEYLFLLPDFFILVCRMAVDKRVPTLTKLKLGGVIAYVMMPLDIIPDFIPVLGYLDDLLILPLLIYLAFRSIPPPLLEEHRRKLVHTV